MSNGAPIYRILFGTVEYRGALNPWLESNADALEGVLDDDDLAEIRALAPGERYAPDDDYALSFVCLRAAGGCICPFGVLRGDCPAHADLVPS